MEWFTPVMVSLLGPDKEPGWEGSSGVGVGGGGGDVVSCWLMFVGLGKRPGQGILQSPHTAHGAEKSLYSPAGNRPEWGVLGGMGGGLLPILQGLQRPISR